MEGFLLRRSLILQFLVSTCSFFIPGSFERPVTDLSLVSLGKSSSAALERLFQQTEALINEISEDGGAGALVNVRADYLV